MTRIVQLAAVLLLWSLLAPAGKARAQDQERSVDLELVGYVGYLTSGHSHGSAIDAGLRAGLGRFFALGFDVGYGVLVGPSAEDRWWIMPTAAFVVELGPLRLDLGAGVGVGAASGYADFDAFQADPFDPDWAFQLAPAARAHVMLALPTSVGESVFLRVDGGALLIEDNDLGIREQTVGLETRDTMWIAVSVGVAVDLWSQ